MWIQLLLMSSLDFERPWNEPLLHLWYWIWIQCDPHRDPECLDTFFLLEAIKPSQLPQKLLKAIIYSADADVLRSIAVHFLSRAFPSSSVLLWFYEGSALHALGMEFLQFQSVIHDALNLVLHSTVVGSVHRSLLLWQYCCYPKLVPLRPIPRPTSSARRVFLFFHWLKLGQPIASIHLHFIIHFTKRRSFWRTL